MNGLSFSLMRAVPLAAFLAGLLTCPPAMAQRYLCNKVGVNCTISDNETATPEETPPPDADVSFATGVVGASADRKVGGKAITKNASQYIAKASRNGSSTYTLASPQWKGDTFRTCMWISASADQRLKTIRSYFEFSLSSEKTSSSGSGFTFAVIPGTTQVDGDSIPCGGAGGYLGYQNAGSQGDMPDEKAAVEWDVLDEGSSGFYDPANNHMAIDRQKVTHSGLAVDGPKCTGGGATSTELTDTNACAVGPNNAWFEDGSSNGKGGYTGLYHPVRVESVYMNSGTCTSGGQSFPATASAPYLKVTAYMWDLYTRTETKTCVKINSKNECTKYATGYAWTAPCTNCKDVTKTYADFSPNADGAPVATVTHCLPVSSAMDKVYLGWTVGTNSKPISLKIRAFGAKVD